MSSFPFCIKVSAGGIYSSKSKSLDMMKLQYFLLLSFIIHSYSSAAVIIYKEDLNASRKLTWISLGGLFSIHENQNGKCGTLRNFVVERVEAMIFAIRRINEDTSILPNVNLTFEIRDTCSIPTRALQQALNYVHDQDSNSIPISAVMGPTFSDSSILVANILGLFRIPQISFASTAATLSDKSRYNYFFRTIPSDALQARVIANLIHKFKWTYIFAFYSTDTYGIDGINSLLEQLQPNKSASLCLALQIGLPLGVSENDRAFDAAVEQMNKEWIRNSSVAVIFGHVQQAQGMLSAVERKLEADRDSPLDNITWIAVESWAIILNSKFYERARGMLAVHPESIVISEFVEYFSTLTPNATSNPWFNDYWELFFNCSLTSKDNACNLEQRLPKNKTLAFEHPNIIQGIYAFALAIHNIISYYCPNQTLCDEIVIPRSTGQAVNGELLRRQLLNISLSDIPILKNEGQLFDKNGDVQNSYTIFNLQTDLSGTYSFHPVGSWDHVNLLNINVSDIEWRSGRKVPQSVCSLPCGPGQEPVSVPNQEQCCWTCRSCLGDFSVSSGDRCYECKEMFIPNSNKSDCIAVPVSYLTWSSPFGIVLLVLTSFGIIVSMGSGIMYAVFIKNTVIKASSRELSAILLGGIFLCYTLPLAFLIKPSAASCAVQRLISGSCFAIVYSALLVKTNRIHRIFNRSESKGNLPRFISPISQVVITLLLSLIQLVIASIWLAVEPPRVKTVLVNRKLLELVCDHNPHATLLVTVVYNLILLTTSAFFAFRTRKVPEHFNEAKFISITVFSLCVIWLAFVPTFYISTTVQIGSEFQTFSLLITILLSASTTLCCLLIPKFYLVIMLKIKKIATETVSVKTTNL